MQGIPELWGLTSVYFPHISASSSSKMLDEIKVFEVQTLYTSSVTIPSLVGFRICTLPGMVKFVKRLSHLNSETILVPLDRGRFVVVHSTLTSCC